MDGVVRSTCLGAVFGLVAAGIMERLLETNAEELVIWIAALAMLLAVGVYVIGKDPHGQQHGQSGVYVIGKVRGASAQHEPSASELLSKCRESHSRGEISDEEFRTIKTTLQPRLREELNDDGETG